MRQGLVAAEKVLQFKNIAIESERGEISSRFFCALYLKELPFQNITILDYTKYLASSRRLDNSNVIHDIVSVFYCFFVF